MLHQQGQGDNTVIMYQSYQATATATVKQDDGHYQ